MGSMSNRQKCEEKLKTLLKKLVFRVHGTEAIKYQVRKVSSLLLSLWHQCYIIF